MKPYFVCLMTGFITCYISIVVFNYTVYNDVMFVQIIYYEWLYIVFFFVYLTWNISCLWFHKRASYFIMHSSLFNSLYQHNFIMLLYSNTQMAHMPITLGLSVSLIVPYQHSTIMPQLYHNYTHLF